MSVPTVLMKTWHIKMCAGHRQEVQHWDVGPMSDVGSGSTPVLCWLEIASLYHPHSPPFILSLKYLAQKKGWASQTE